MHLSLAARKVHNVKKVAPLCNLSSSNWFCNQLSRCNAMHASTEPEPKSKPRFNEFGIQMLSQKMYEQIFKDVKPRELSAEDIESSINHLKKFDLLNKEPDVLEDISFNLPKLSGDNIDSHFQNIAKQQAQKYFLMLYNLVQSPLPPMPTPEEWSNKAGWTMYTRLKDGSLQKQTVDCPP